MNLKKQFLTKNECYITGDRHTVKGIMVHSTGANNPDLKRYVGPNDGLLGVNAYGNHWNTYRPGGRQVCVNAFIGKLADGSIATYQTLPWDMVGWHSGGGSKGSANRMGYIGFEICEDGLNDAAYLKKVYQEAVDLCAYLCKQYKLDPLKDGVIICHSEGHARGIASNHGDVMHWWPRHGLNMDTFRKAVATAVGDSGGGGTMTTPTPSTPPAGAAFAVGDTVEFTGAKHFVSSTATNPASCKPGKAKITAIAKSARHPYHLVAAAGKGSTVHGWVDANTIQAAGGTSAAASYRVRITAEELNIRKGPGTGYSTNGSIKGKGVYTIVAEASGAGATKWGKLKSGTGWISLDYTTKI